MKPMSIKQQFRTVLVLTKLNTRRFFRDRLAQFFAILFPLIFLFVFGGLSSSNGNNVSFRVAVINQSTSPFATTFVKQLTDGKIFKVDPAVHSLSAAEDKLSRSQIDGIIVLPGNFGALAPGQTYPSGQAQLIYSQSSSGTRPNLELDLAGDIQKD